MKIEPIEFKAGQETLKGNLYLSDNPKKLAVLFLHGWTGLPNEDVGKLLARNGYSSMTFCLSGHGNSSGKLDDQTHEKSLNEALAVFDFFVAKMPDGTKVGVTGNSYGGYLAAILSAERPISFIQMRVPANYPDERWNDQQLGQSEEVWDWRHNKLGPGATRSLRSLSRFNGPVQIIEAELDESVPHQTIQNYVDAVKNKSKLDYHFMQGWPHSLGLDKERNQQYQKLLLTWLNNIREQI